MKLQPEVASTQQKITAWRRVVAGSAHGHFRIMLQIFSQSIKTTIYGSTAATTAKGCNLVGRKTPHAAEW